MDISVNSLKMSFCRMLSHASFSTGRPTGRYAARYQANITVSSAKNPIPVAFMMIPLKSRAAESRILPYSFKKPVCSGCLSGCALPCAQQHVQLLFPILSLVFDAKVDNRECNQVAKSLCCGQCSDFQHLFFSFQIFFVEQRRRNGAGFDIIARLAGIVIIRYLFFRQLFFGDDSAFQFQEVVHAGAVRVFDEQYSSGYRVAVVVETEVKPFEHMRKIVHRQLQVDCEQCHLR